MGVAFKLTLTVDRNAAAQVGGDIAYREVVDVTRRVFNRANVLTPVDTGRLRAGNQMRTQRQGPVTTGEVFNDTAYAGPVHSGSRAHVIRPRYKKALRFVIGGRVVFATRVNMPARKGRPWILRAIREVAVQRGYRITT